MQIPFSYLPPELYFIWLKCYSWKYVLSHQNILSECCCITIAMNAANFQKKKTIQKMNTTREEDTSCVTTYKILNTLSNKQRNKRNKLCLKLSKLSGCTVIKLNKDFMNCN